MASIHSWWHEICPQKKSKMRLTNAQATNNITTKKNLQIFITNTKAQKPVKIYNYN